MRRRSSRVTPRSIAPSPPSSPLYHLPSSSSPPFPLRIIPSSSVLTGVVRPREGHPQESRHGASRRRLRAPQVRDADIVRRRAARRRTRAGARRVVTPDGAPWRRPRQPASPPRRRRRLSGQIRQNGPDSATVVEAGFAVGVGSGDIFGERGFGGRCHRRRQPVRKIRRYEGPGGTSSGILRNKCRCFFEIRVDGLNTLFGKGTRRSCDVYRLPPTERPMIDR